VKAPVYQHTTSTIDITVSVLTRKHYQKKEKKKKEKKRKNPDTSGSSSVMAGHESTNKIMYPILMNILVTLVRHNTYNTFISYNL